MEGNLFNSPKKIKIVLIIAAIFFALMSMFMVIIGAVVFIKFDMGSDNKDKTNNDNYMALGNNSNYWWPIGSNEIVVKNDIEYASGEPASLSITSNFGFRSDPFTKVTRGHGGIDISGVENSTNVIASNSGTVVYPNSLGTDTCPSSSTESDCGGGYGNYIIIRHNDGNYTLYAHLYPNTIKVKNGDHVSQGQLIAKVGSSGRSTGGHLHFEFRLGYNSGAARVDPLNYVSVDDSRKTAGSTSSDFLAMLHSFEGTGPTEGDYYIVYGDTGGVLTVGHGVTLAYNKEQFANLGINVNNLSKGSKIEKELVDKVENSIIESKKTSIINLLDSNDIQLKDYQIDALVLRMYNVGNVNKFPAMYKQYGDTQALYDNFMRSPTTDVKGNYLTALAKRRAMEWDLFHNGTYSLFG